MTSYAPEAFLPSSVYRSSWKFCWGKILLYCIWSVLKDTRTVPSGERAIVTAWTTCAPRDVEVSINLAHSDVTIDVSTQKSLPPDVKLCTSPLYKYVQKSKNNLNISIIVPLLTQSRRHKLAEVGAFGSRRHRLSTLRFTFWKFPGSRFACSLRFYVDKNHGSTRGQSPWLSCTLFFN